MHMSAFDSRMVRAERGSPRGGEPWTKRLHYLAGTRSLCRPLGLNDQMGQYAELIGVAADYFTKGGGGGAPSGGPAPTGSTTGMQQPGAGSTVISPVIQTRISPQISPVFSQMQSSPGGVQAGTTTQYSPGGMYAEGGSAPIPGALPARDYAPPPVKVGGFPISTLDPLSLTPISAIPTAGTLIRDIRESEPFNWTPVYWVGGAALVAVVALTFVKKRAA